MPLPIYSIFFSRVGYNGRSAPSIMRTHPQPNATQPEPPNKAQSPKPHILTPHFSLATHHSAVTHTTTPFNESFGALELTVFEHG